MDRNRHAKGIRVPDETFAALSLEPNRVHGQWTYRISPKGSD